MLFGLFLLEFGMRGIREKHKGRSRKKHESVWESWGEVNRGGCGVARRRCGGQCRAGAKTRLKLTIRIHARAVFSMI